MWEWAVLQKLEAGWPFEQVQLYSIACFLAGNVVYDYGQQPLSFIWPIAQLKD